MLFKGHSTHADIRESARVNYWVGSHNLARTSSSWMYQLWISDSFEWFFTVNFLYPKLCPPSIQANHACHSEVLIRFFGTASLSAAHVCQMWRTAAKRFVRHVCFRNQCPLFLFAKTFNPLGNQRVGKVENWVGSYNPARTSSGSMFELWISDVFEWSFAIIFLYPKFAVLARSKQLMLVTVKSCESRPHVSM